MRPKVIAAVIGLLAAVGGIGLLGYGISRISGAAAYSDCIGDDCLNDPWFLAFPGGILAMVFGLIIASWALSSIRNESSSMGPLRAFGFMTGLGAVFFALGSIFLISSNVAGDATDGTFVFLGVLFGLIGLVFIGIDLLRFREELRKDRLRASGLKGTARVVGVSNTNITINDRPMVNLDLEVTIAGQSPFRARKRTVISPQSVGALMPGATIAVLADPAKPTDIVLNWEAGTVPGAREPNAIVQAMTGFGPGAFGGLGETMSTEILRSVSQALASAAERSDHGGAVTRMPDGTTVVDGGATVVVNGKVVPASELGGLPAAILAAIAGAGQAGHPPAGAAPTGATIQFTARTAAMGSEAGTVYEVGTVSPVAADEVVADLAVGTAGTQSRTWGDLDALAARSASPTPAAEAAPEAPATDVPAPDIAASTEGLPARVSLETIQDTGVDVAGNRLYAFDLTVSVAGRTPYPVKHSAVVPKALVPRLMQGASFPADVDPAQPGQINVHWDR